MKLTDQYKGTTADLVKRVMKLEKWKRDKTGDSALFDIANEHTPTTLAADQNNYDPGFYDVLRINSTQDISITGITRGQKGRFLEFYNTSIFKITLPYESASSTDINRIINSSGEDIRLFPTGRVRLYYDSTLERWVIPDPPSWRGTYGMSVKLYLSDAGGYTSGQQFTAGVGAQILFDTIDPTVGDPYGFFDAANNRIVIPAGMGGLYTGRLSGTWEGIGGESGTMRKISYVNSGAVFTAPGTSVPSVDGWTMDVSCPISLICAPGDIITFDALQDSALDIWLYNIELHFGRLG